MSFMKTNQDELLDGFCRGCLSKYHDPADLLHYTEKNRKLFVYSTGIQVKPNDTFTFQLCKDCYMNMKLSCKFKKQCRTSDRKFKSFLRLKELGDGLDLITFLKHSDDNIKFPLLSGNSTPANQKNREDDNESTCASIRNFMSEILPDEDMPDTEARIIKEVIEEEADLMEDSLDSHWLQDDASIDADFRLDFSFSPFATPHSVNNDYTPIKQIEPSLQSKNNHAKRVFQQLPTARYLNDENAIKHIEPYKAVVPSNSYKQKKQIDHNVLRELDSNQKRNVECSNDDSLNELINRNEDLFPVADADEINVKSIDSNTIFTIPSHDIQDTFSICENDTAVKSINLNAFETEFHMGEHQLRDISMKSVNLSEIQGKKIQNNTDDNNYDNKSKQNYLCSIAENDTRVESKNSYMVPESVIKNETLLNNMQTSESQSFDDSNSFQVPETELSVEPVGIHENDRQKSPMTETDLAVKNIKLLNDVFKSESPDARIIFPLSKTKNTVKHMDVNASETDGKKFYNMIENDRAVKSITLNEYDSEDYRVHKEFKTENHASVKIIKSSSMELESPIIQKHVSTNQNEESVESIDSDSSEVDLPVNKKQFTKDEDDLTPKSNEFDSYRQNPEEINHNQVDVEQKAISLNTFKTNSHMPETKLETYGNYVPVTSVDLKAFETKSLVNNYSVGHENLQEIIDNTVNQNHEQNNAEHLDNNEPSLVESNDNDLEESLKIKIEKKIIVLEDLLVSPGEVYKQTKDFVSGASTPTINNILFGEKLDNDEDSKTSHGLETYKTVEDTDVLDEFFKETVKDFEEKNLVPNVPELPLELKYDLQSLDCKMCNKKYTNQRGFKIHLNKVHKIVFPKKEYKKNHVCNQCGLVMTDKSNFARHIRIHNKKLLEEFKCDLCELTFKAKSKYKMHLKSHKNDTEENSEQKPKKYLCNICGASFKAASNFVVHKRRHANDFSHMCEVCDKGFCRTTDLVVHMRSHNDDRPYKCSTCTKAFRTKYSLVKHMRSHMDDKVYQCDHCSARFALKKQIAKHVHKSERCKKKRSKMNREKNPKVKVKKVWPYQCSYCSQPFAKKLTLVKHQAVSACARQKKKDDEMYFEALEKVWAEKPKTPIRYEEMELQDMPVLIE